MKRREIKACAVCGEGVMHNNNVLFYHVRMRRMGVDLSAVDKLRGLEMMFGSPTLATVMGPDEDLAVELDSFDELICSPCAFKGTMAEVFERAALSKEEQEA